MKKKKRKKERKEFFLKFNNNNKKYANISRDFSGAVAVSVGSVQF